jgi:hypothetical protein
MKTKLPALSSGSSRYGAQMGRANALPLGDFTGRLHLVRLRWVDGDYDQGGAYWGNSRGTAIFRALGADECELTGFGLGCPECFVRAADRDAAKDAVRKLIPGARFYR